MPLQQSTFENFVTKGEIAHFEQFLLLSLCFQKAVYCIGVRKLLMRICFLMERFKKNLQTERNLNPFPHMTILQQMTLNIICQKIENLYN